MDAKTVKKLYDDYVSLYKENNERGKNSIMFCSANDQWLPGVKAARDSKNKETLVVNEVKKYVNKIKSQGRQIDFQINAYETVDNTQAQEYQAFKLLFQHALSNPKINNVNTDAYDKLIDYGYAVVEVSYDYCDRKTLNKDPLLILYEDPSEAFFDLSNLDSDKNRTMGNYSGRRRRMDKKALVESYPELAANDDLKDKDNIVFDFWYRKRESCWYVLMQTGQYWRQDLLTDEDYLNAVWRSSSGKIKRKRGDKPCIYYCRYINEIAVIEDRPYPTEDLPLVYHSALTEWSDKGYMTYPYAYYLQDPQRLLNFSKSALATALKNSTAVKVFFNQSHLTNDKDKDMARNINQYEGAMILGDDPQKMMIVPATEIPATLINLAQQCSQDIESVAGSVSDMQMSDSVVTSGVAIKEITNNIQMMNAGLVAEHIRFIDTISRLLVQMLPNIWVEERDFFVKNENGQMIKVGVNIRTDSTIKNDIKDIQDKFMYEVKAGATTTMQQETTRKYIMELGAVNPQMMLNMSDILFENMDVPDARKLALRARAMIDPIIVAYGNGEMTDEQLLDARKDQADAAKNAQQPEPPSMKMAAQAEQAKAAAAVENVQINRQKVEAQIQQDQTKLQLEIAKLQAQIQDKANQHEINKAKLQLEATQKLIDAQHLQDEKKEIADGDDQDSV